VVTRKIKNHITLVVLHRQPDYGARPSLSALASCNALKQNWAQAHLRQLARCSSAIRIGQENAESCADFNSRHLLASCWLAGCLFLTQAGCQSAKCLSSLALAGYSYSIRDLPCLSNGMIPCWPCCPRCPRCPCWLLGVDLERKGDSMVAAAASDSDIPIGLALDHNPQRTRPVLPPPPPANVIVAVVAIAVCLVACPHLVHWSAKSASSLRSEAFPTSLFFSHSSSQYSVLLSLSLAHLSSATRASVTDQLLSLCIKSQHHHSTAVCNHPKSLTVEGLSISLRPPSEHESIGYYHRLPESGNRRLVGS
jgi:hypothetical protein